MGKLKDKVCIVTGGARGIGNASSVALCEAGASVVITDIQPGLGQEIVDRLIANGHQALFVRHDVRSVSGWEKAVGSALDKFGRIDCLVNNAGGMVPRTVENATPEDIRDLMELNVTSNLLGMQAVLPALKDAGGGSIVNICSNVSTHLMPLGAVYAASKAAQATLSKCAALHFAEQGYNIRVNTVHPGGQQTEFLMGGSENKEVPPADYLNAYIQTIPMKRFGYPPEVAEVVVFLADCPAYMTGSEIFIDGGVHVI